MEDTRRQYCIGAPFGDAVGEMLQVADAAAGDHRDIDRIGHRTRQRKIESILRAIAIHAGQQDFAGAELLHATRPVDGIEARSVATAVREYLPLARLDRFGVDGDDDALVPNFGRSFGDEIGIIDRGSVHAHLVGTGVEQPADVGDRAHAATNSQRDEDLGCARFYDVQDDVALVGRRGDIEEGHFVGALQVVTTGNFHWVAGIAQIDKVGPLDDPPGGDVKAGDDAFRETQSVYRSFVQGRKSIAVEAVGFGLRRCEV